jgi:hypothetical protein
LYLFETPSADIASIIVYAYILHSYNKKYDDTL